MFSETEIPDRKTCFEVECPKVENNFEKCPYRPTIEERQKREV
jgi:hypothetical protein